MCWINISGKCHYFSCSKEESSRGLFLTALLRAESVLPFSIEWRRHCFPILRSKTNCFHCLHKLHQESLQTKVTAAHMLCYVNLSSWLMNFTQVHYQGLSWLDPEKWFQLCWITWIMLDLRMATSTTNGSAWLLWFIPILSYQAKAVSNIPPTFLDCTVGHSWHNWQFIFSPVFFKAWPFSLCSCKANEKLSPAATLILISQGAEQSTHLLF